MLKPRNRELNPPRCLTVRRILEVISCGFEGDGVLWRFDHNERWYQTTESVFNHKHGKQEGNKSRDEHDSSPCWDLDLVTMLSVSIKPTSDERSGNVHFDVLLKERR